MQALVEGTRVYRPKNLKISTIISDFMIIQVDLKLGTITYCHFVDLPVRLLTP